MCRIVFHETDPVVWRGPIIAGAVKQFWTDVIWGDVDYMFIDMPPGTGDVPLTVFQSIPLDGIIIVTSPQELVSMIVSKAVNMKVTYNLRREIAAKIQKLPFQYYDTTSNGEVLSHITNDVDAISQSLNQSVTQIITSVATVIGILIMMFSISWQMTLVALCIIPISM